MVPIQERHVYVNEIQLEIISCLQFESIESSSNDEVMTIRRSLIICKLAIPDNYIVYLIASDFDIKVLKYSITFSQVMNGNKHTFYWML